MDKQLRILHVVRQFHPAIGGLESYVKNMAEHQINLGHRCAVLTLNRVFFGETGKLPATGIVGRIPIYRVPFIGRRRYFLPIVSPSFLRRFDVIHVHNTDVFFDYIPVLALTGFLKKPVFATTHGGFFHTQDFSAIKKIYFKFVTRNTGRYYRAMFAISQNDFDIFKGINENLILKPNAIRPCGDFISEGSDFVYLGRLSRHKNVDMLVRVFALLKTRYGVSGKLHIFGPEWDVKTKELKNLAIELGAGNDVILHGYIPEAEIRQVLKNCGFFMSASSYEGFGMSMLEAMSVGLIPFVQPNASFLELLTASGVGACMDFTRTEEAAEKIAGLMNAVSQKDRKKAREFALRFSWEKLASDTVSIYREFG